MTRRDALKIIVLGNLAPKILPIFDQTATSATLKSCCSGTLAFHNLHTDECLSIRYLNKRGKFDRNALRKLNHLFRCHFTGKIHTIDPELFLALDATRSRLGAKDRPYQLVSGYRSPLYNKSLRSNGHGVAKKSFHLKGMAADVSMEGVKLDDLQRVASSFKVGGVGTYPDFVHIDVGPVRYWGG